MLDNMKTFDRFCRFKKSFPHFRLSDWQIIDSVNQSL